MAGHSGQFYTFALGRQTAKGTAQTVPKIKVRLTGGIVVPDPQMLDLPETDSSIQRSKTIKVGQLIGGAIEGFVRSDEAGFLAYMHLGTEGVTGAGPYTHTASAAANPPYGTGYSAFDATALVDRYVDLRIPEMTWKGGSGQALGYTAAFMGITATHGETDPVLAASAVDPLVYPNVTVTYAGATTDIVTDFTVHSQRAAQPIQGDTGIVPSDIYLGRWAANGTLRVLFETDAIWRNWLTNSPSGTASSLTLYKPALSIVASRSASDSVTWTVTEAGIRKVTLVPDPAGNPLFYDIEWAAEPQTTIANTLNVVSVNSITTY